MNKIPAPIIYYFKNKRIPKDIEWRFLKGKTTRSGPGPDKSTGGLLAAPFQTDHEAIYELTYDPKKQTWHKYQDFYIGFRNDLKSADLANPQILPGYKVSLGKLGEFIIPVAKLDTPNFSLPSFEVPQDNGEWKWEPDEAYAHLSIFAENIYEAVQDDGSFEFDDAQLRTICCEIIAVNYNLSDIECGLLRMLNSSSYMGICQALIDQPGAAQILEHMEGKKKLSEE